MSSHNYFLNTPPAKYLFTFFANPVFSSASTIIPDKEAEPVAGKCGFVFEPGNFRELSNIIYNALKNKSRMMDIAKCFSSKVKENYGPENFKRKYFRLLNL